MTKSKLYLCQTLWFLVSMVLQFLWIHFLATSVGWRAWPISLSQLGSWWDCIHSQNSLVLWGDEIISANISALVERGSWVVGRNFPVCCAENFLADQTVLEALGLRRGLNGSSMSKAVLSITLRAWAGRFLNDPPGTNYNLLCKCCNYICGGILKLLMVFHR